ncbi:MAG: transglutaminase-like domain-containing protein [Candidatus Thermoplasmatota archaeon]|nr:transglutaminase-like domain-containing protein [Candidatus Thermoplasmatota archaeon]
MPKLIEDDFSVWDDDEEMDEDESKVESTDRDGIENSKRSERNGRGKSEKGLREDRKKEARSDRGPKSRTGKSKGKDREGSGSRDGSRPHSPLGNKGKASKGFLRSKPFIWTMRVITVLIVLAILFLPFKPLSDAREDVGLNKLRNLMRPFRDFPEMVNVTFSVRYDVKISSGTADMVRIKTSIPFDILDGRDDFKIQDVTDVVLTPSPTSPLPDYNEQKNNINMWELRNQRGDFSFTAQYSALLYTYQWNIDDEDSGTIEDIPQTYKDNYLDDEWIVKDSNGDIIDKDGDGRPDLYRYHPSHPTVKNAAVQITKDKNTVYGKVKAIYDWMQEHFNYTTNEQKQRDLQVYGSYPKYPIGCMNDWYGDCDDQSLLMASLCRAVGIPAWLEIGYLYDPMQGSWGGHGWFNVIIPLKGSGSVIAPIDPVNHEFLFRDPYRLTDWIDTGRDIIDDEGELIFNLDYYYNFFKVRKSSSVDVDVRMTTNSINYEKRGSIRQYVDQKLEPGNIPGTEGGMGSLPFPLITIAIPALLPIVRKRKRLSY